MRVYVLDGADGDAADARAVERARWRLRRPRERMRPRGAEALLAQHRDERRGARVATHLKGEPRRGPRARGARSRAARRACWRRARQQRRRAPPGGPGGQRATPTLTGRPPAPARPGRSGRGDGEHADGFRRIVSSVASASRLSSAVSPARPMAAIEIVASASLGPVVGPEVALRGGSPSLSSVDRRETRRHRSTRGHRIAAAPEREDSLAWSEVSARATELVRDLRRRGGARRWRRARDGQKKHGDARTVAHGTGTTAVRGRRVGGHQEETSTILVTSGGAPRREGGPATPKPRLTHIEVPCSS